MKKRIAIRRLVLLMSISGWIGVIPNAYASAFQLWEQDGASVGNYHAGYAATAEDASTAYENPAGLIRIPNKELVISADPILTNFKYKGDIKVNTLGNLPQYSDAQGGQLGLVPGGHFAIPVARNLVFGVSIVAPFGLKTNYGYNTPLRYAATETALTVVDYTPSVGFAFNDKFSVGAGVDFEHADATFNLVATAFSPILDTNANNNGSSNAWGYHLGALYQFTSETRLGVSYHSKVTHDIQGKSRFAGPLANDGNEGSQESDNLKFNVDLPASTSVSLYHTVNSAWDVMGTLSWTQWSVFKDIIIQNVAGVQNGVSSNAITVIVPENYHNTWNYSIGANYHINKQWFLRTGLGYDPTPSNDQDRNAQLPDSDRIVASLGTHYQVYKTVGIDIGWSHFFAMNTRLANNVQTVGDQVTTTSGSVSAGADVFGFGLKWDIV